MELRSSALIEAKGVTFSYDSDDANKKLILNDITLDITPGSFVAILGHNGSGKSTLAKHFNAILTPDTGSVTVDGIDTQNEELLFDIRKTVGMVFQNPDNQIVATIVEEDVAFAMENLGIDPEIMQKRVDKVLNDVGMVEYRDKAPHQLSGGQKQRIAIAGILAMEPKCIVLDEPTAMLDPKGRREVMQTIKRMNKEQNTTVVLITHYMDEAVQADRVCVVDHGKLIMDGTPKEVFSHVQTLKEIGLDVPQVTDVAHTLIQAGVELPMDILTPEEFIAAVDNLLMGE